MLVRGLAHGFAEQVVLMALAAKELLSELGGAVDPGRVSVSRSWARDFEATSPGTIGIVRRCGFGDRLRLRN